jgi:hypothetical protein
MEAGVSAADFAAMTDIHERHDARVIVNGVNHPVVLLPNAIVVMSRELLAAGWPRVLFQAPQTFRDLTRIALRIARNSPSTDS